MYYQQKIQALLSEYPDAPANTDPRWVLAFMRDHNGTLDGLSSWTFFSEFKTALQCIAAAGPEHSESLAASYGL